MAFPELDIIKEKINNELQNLFDRKIKEAGKVDPFAVEMVRALEDFTMRGGKRIRAAMIYYGYTAFCQDDLDEVIKACICIELIQSFFLIHDDIIDKDDLRRGGPTLHKMFEDYHRKNFKLKSPGHFGRSMAMLVGDLAGSISNELFADIGLLDKNKLAAIIELNKMESIVVFGESLDILSELREELTKEDLLKVNRYKTSSYTFDSPLRIGALLAGAGIGRIRPLHEYGMNLGMAFQLQDDILGIFGNQEVFGKPIGSDFREGKTTLLSLKTMELAEEKDRKFVRSMLGKQDISHEEVERLKTIIKTCGSLDYCTDLMKALIEKAKSAVTGIDINEDSRNFLIKTADYIINRKI
jgi:geranylgeranyl diphosphate synthase type I